MSSTSWIGLGIIVAVIVGVLLLLNQVSKPYDVKDEDEFEKRRKESAGMMVAGLKGLQAILDPAEKKAAIVQQDLQRGLYDDKEEADDPPEAGAAAWERGRSRTVREGTNDQREDSDDQRRGE
jgi:hypothetical protein